MWSAPSAEMRLEVAENEAPKPPRVEECGDGIPFQLTMGSGVAPCKWSIRTSQTHAWQREHELICCEDTSDRSLKSVWSGRTFAIISQFASQVPRTHLTHSISWYYVVIIQLPRTTTTVRKTHSAALKPDGEACMADTVYNVWRIIMLLKYTHCIAVMCPLQQQ